MNESKLLWYGEPVDGKSKEELIEIIRQLLRMTQYGATVDPETAPQALRELADRIERRQTVKR